MDFDFTEYCWDFYGPAGIYGEFFNHSLTRAELKAAIEEYMLTQTADFAADSIDRERIRDIMFVNRGQAPGGI